MSIEKNYINTADEIDKDLSQELMRIIFTKLTITSLVTQEIQSQVIDFHNRQNIWKTLVSEFKKMKQTSDSPINAFGLSKQMNDSITHYALHVMKTIKNLVEEKEDLADFEKNTCSKKTIAL